jgi:hypothetical protein
VVFDAGGVAWAVSGVASGIVLDPDPLSEHG